MQVEEEAGRRCFLGHGNSKCKEVGLCLVLSEQQQGSHCDWRAWLRERVGGGEAGRCWGQIVRSLGGRGKDFGFYPSEMGAVQSSEQGRQDPTQVLTGTLWLLQMEQTIMCEGRSWETWAETTVVQVENDGDSD